MVCFYRFHLLFFAAFLIHLSDVEKAVHSARFRVNYPKKQQLPSHHTIFNEDACLYLGQFLPTIPANQSLLQKGFCLQMGRRSASPVNILLFLLLLALHQSVLSFSCFTCNTSVDKDDTEPCEQKVYLQMGESSKMDEWVDHRRKNVLMARLESKAARLSFTSPSEHSPDGLMCANSALARGFHLARCLSDVP